MDTITNQQTINNAHNIPFMTHVFLIIYVFLHVVLFINKVTCPIYITTLTFGSRNNDKICINISTVNSCFKGTILNVNENFIKWVCNKKFIQFEYIISFRTL
jgi:hypothetical protein